LQPGSLVNCQAAAGELSAVEIGDGVPGFDIVRHLHERETARQPGAVITDDVNAANFPERLE
jgi:hypothetical protein